MNVAIPQELRLRFRRRLQLEGLLCVVCNVPGEPSRTPCTCIPDTRLIVARLIRAYEIKDELGLMTREERFKVPLLASVARVRVPSERYEHWLDAHVPKRFWREGLPCIRPMDWLDGINSVDPGFGTQPKRRLVRCAYHEEIAHTHG